MRFLVFVNRDTRFVMLKVFRENSSKVFTCEMPTETAHELRKVLDDALKQLEAS